MDLLLLTHRSITVSYHNRPNTAIRPYQHWHVSWPMSPRTEHSTGLLGSVPRQLGLGAVLPSPSCCRPTEMESARHSSHEVSAPCNDTQSSTVKLVAQQSRASSPPNYSPAHLALARPTKPPGACIQQISSVNKTNKNWLPWQRPAKDEKTNFRLIIYSHSSSTMKIWQRLIW